MSTNTPSKNHSSLQGTEPISERIISYINVDSGQRNRESSNVYDAELYTLPPYPLIFTNGSRIVTINLSNHSFVQDDRIALNNVLSKYIILQNILQVKKNSLFVKIHNPNHGLSLYGLYDPTNSTQFIPIGYVDNLPESYNETDDIPDTVQHFILNVNATTDLTIQLSNIKGLDISRTMIGNIPVNYLKRKQKVYLLFTKNGNTFVPDPDYYLIMLQKRSAINYADNKNYMKDKSETPTNIISTNTVHIQFYNLFGVPLKYLNSGTPINENMVYPYHTVIDVTENTFSIDISYNAIVDPYYSFYNYNDSINSDNNVNIIGSSSGGGNQVFVRKVLETIDGYPNPNLYEYNLDRSYKNIVQARIVSSIFPNSQRIINNNGNDIINNRLYWRNLDDGDYIYFLEIPPGNYSISALENEIETAFSNKLRYPYSEEYQAGIYPEIVGQSTPTNSLRYDENGINKYHIIDVSISSETDVVSFTSYREIVQSDEIEPGPISNRILVVPDYLVEFTMAENLQTNIGIGGTDIVPFETIPFSPDNNEQLYIYFTPNTQIRIKDTFPYTYHNLYKYVENIIPNNIPLVPGVNTFIAQLDTETAILVNFFRTKGIFPNPISVQEINSINTNTLLDNFYYDFLTNIVTKVNHQLNIGGLIITDQFNSHISLNQIFVYEITEILDADKFTVARIIPGTKYKFIYDSLIINFSADSNDTVYWLDQIIEIEPIMTLPPPFEFNNNTLSMVMVKPRPENKQILRVYHPNHQFKAGYNIMISGSASINQVPSDAINREHTINKILNDDHYEILLDKYTFSNIPVILDHTNTVFIRYPDIFQMFFSYPDTLGKILSFRNSGDSGSVTSYNHTIKNTNPYANEYRTSTIPPIKLDMAGPTYFYISSPELANHYHNTKPVPNVFAIGRWFDEPGTVVFDSVVPSVRVFSSPLKSLSQLNIAISHPDGRLVEFNGLDHQFTIEILEDRKHI